MSVKKFSYKGQDVVITEENSHPKVSINGKDIAVAINDKDSYTPVQHLPYSSFSSLEDIAKEVIDKNLMH